MDDYGSPVKFKREAKRRKISISKERCLNCGGGGKMVSPQR